MRTLRSLQSVKNIKLIIAVVIPLVILFLPTSVFPFAGLTIIQQRVIALFFMAALFWVLEPIPIFATSVLLITLELLLLSDSGIVWLQHKDNEHFGVLLSYKEIMGTFASPVILLFLGGFFLAEAASKYRLDQNIAGLLLPKFGKNPKIVLLGLMGLSAVFSMFMSNTATTAMMLAIIIPLLKTFPNNDKSKIAFILGIPFAANLGGLGTPIGTPPNAIALKFLSDAHLTFGKWMAFGVPVVLIMLLVCWLLMITFFPSSAKEVNLSIKVDFLKTPKAKLVYLTFIVTILLWLLDFVHGMNSYVVAMLPVCVFITTGVINKEDLKRISWDVLWLVSGGIALGLALEKTGLATLVIQSIPFDQFHPYTIFIFCTLIGLAMANFMSHTATANLLLPLMATIGVSITGMQQVGGSAYMVVATTFCISLGMSLPISSPPNALANATGLVQTKDMAKVGALVGLIGWLLVLGMMSILYLINFLS
ncbi:MAG: SLC13 family permease [Cyclobacteriaceae bacterium]|jgi:sodium-dependent dicarboxylate transporter 2/3/5|nr:SLC13 family permease [Cyclobacteriaceae bacterium]